MSTWEQKGLLLSSPASLATRAVYLKCSAHPDKEEAPVPHLDGGAQECRLGVYIQGLDSPLLVAEFPNTAEGLHTAYDLLRKLREGVASAANRYFEDKVEEYIGGKK